MPGIDPAELAARGVSVVLYPDGTLRSAGAAGLTLELAQNSASGKLHAKNGYEVYSDGSVEYFNAFSDNDGATPMPWDAWVEQAIARVIDSATRANAAATRAAASPWSSAGQLVTPQLFPELVALGDGSALVIGGHKPGPATSLAAVQRWDPSSNTWQTARPMNERRSGHSAVVLPGGDVFVVGGATADLFRMHAGAWRPLAPPLTPRKAQVVHVLPDGRVLVAGGRRTPAAEIWDPVADGWIAAGTLAVAREEPRALVPAPGGRAVIFGDAAAPEVWDPATNAWSQFAAHAGARCDAVAALPDGRLIAFTRPDREAPTTSIEIWDPAPDRWRVAAELADAHSEGRIVLVDGAVVILGGYGADARSNHAAARWDLESERVSIFDGPETTPEAAVVLRDGRILCVMATGRTAIAPASVGR